MSFQKIPTYFNNHKHKHRKETDSLSAKTLNQISYINIERTSAFTSKGSITLEAALVIPIFFFAMLCLVYLFEMTAIRTTMRSALHSVGREIAKEAYASPIVSPRGIEQHLIQNIGQDRLESSIVSGGVNGLDCGASTSDWGSAEIELVVQYQLNIPILMFRIPAISCEERLRVKGWTGYVSGGNSSSREEIVYITDYGLVYHKDMYCTYLELSIRAVKAEEIEKLRNQSGGRYYACESCGQDNGDAKTLYVTDYGERYHTSLECSKVKRNIYAVPLDEVYGLGGCSKCVK